MKSSDFEKSFTLIENNFGIIALDVKLKIWESMKSVGLSDWNIIVENILRLQWKPRFADFIGYKVEVNRGASKDIFPRVMQCGECRQSYNPKSEYEANMKVCPKCLAYFRTPEGRAEQARRKERLIKKFGELGRR